MIRTQRWRPDTCGCVIIQTYDPDDPSFVWKGTTEFKCSAHNTLLDNDEHYEFVRKDNQLKNRVYAELLEVEDLTDLVVGPNGIFKQFKYGAEMEWSFQGTGKTRTLTVTLTSKVLEDSIDKLQKMKADKSTKQVDDKLTELTNQYDELSLALAGHADELRAVFEAKFGIGAVTLNV